MLNAELWTQGFIIMIVAMGIVFGFLTVLVFAMQIMTKCIMFINKIWPEKVEETKQKTKTTTNDESEIALAIAVARAKG